MIARLGEALRSQSQTHLQTYKKRSGRMEGKKRCSLPGFALQRVRAQWWDVWGHFRPNRPTWAIRCPTLNIFPLDADDISPSHDSLARRTDEAAQNVVRVIAVCGLPNQRSAAFSPFLDNRASKSADHIHSCQIHCCSPRLPPSRPRHRLA